MEPWQKGNTRGNMKPHCMVDLETLGTRSNSVIIAIGAVTFNAKEILEKFYTNVSVDSGLKHGLNVDQGAIKFWLTDADDRARRRLYDPPPRGLRDALSYFTTFYLNTGSDWLWSHGANFDEPVLRASYNAVYGEFVPWAFRNVRDTRTLYALAGGKLSVERGDDKHDALADAVYQAKCVQKAYEILGKELEQ